MSKEIWESSDDESDECMAWIVNHDELEHMHSDVPTRTTFECSSSLIDHRARLRKLDAEVLSRRYWEAVAEMSEYLREDTVARASTQQLSVFPHVGGHLWEVSRAATDEELPRVIRHFLADKDPRGVTLHVLAPQGQASFADPDEEDKDVEVRCRNLSCFSASTFVDQ